MSAAHRRPAMKSPGYRAAGDQSPLLAAKTVFPLCCGVSPTRRAPLRSTGTSCPCGPHEKVATHSEPSHSKEKSFRRGVAIHSGICRRKTGPLISDTSRGPGLRQRRRPAIERHAHFDQSRLETEFLPGAVAALQSSAQTIAGGLLNPSVALALPADAGHRVARLCARN